MHFARIVLNIPHAAPVFPFGRTGWNGDIDAEVANWTDWYTDWLFASSSRLDDRIVPVQFPFLRFFCDAERLVDDPLEEAGQGIVYERFAGLSRAVSGAERRFAGEAYSEHRERLCRVITEGTLVVDCHSFPADLSGIDVCLGVNDDWSRPDRALLDRASLHFRRAGYTAQL